MMPEAGPDETCRTLSDLQRWGRACLRGPDAARESEMLLGHALRRERAWLFAHAGDAIDDSDARARFARLVAERARGVPVAHLLERWGFWTLDLRVTPDTLVPRPETELLVEVALELTPRDAEGWIADLGTGSGAIALALAKERPRARVLATDASPAALDVARGNADALRLGNVHFASGDWYQALPAHAFDLIVSNPPYIASDDPHLQRGDLRFEPIGALASGGDGLDAIRVLAQGARHHLRAQGWLVIEHGYAQGGAVRAIFSAEGLVEVTTRLDLEGRERVTMGRCNAPVSRAPAASTR